MSTVRIQLRRGTAADWTSVNPVLAAGEAGYESDTKKIKVGDGTSTWTALGYATITPAQLSAAIATGIASDLTAQDINTALGYTAANVADVSGLSSQTSTDISNAITTAESYTDSVIATEVSNRNTAISAKSVDTLSQAEDFATNADSVLHQTITTEIATAKSQAITTAEGYTDSAVSTEITNRNSAINTAITNLINGAPAALDTLKEISDHLAADESTASALATTVSGKVSKSGDVMSGNLSMGGNKVADLATPTANTDAATKSYVDSNISDTATSATAYTDAAKTSAVNLAASNAAGIYATKTAPTFTGTITASEKSLDGIVLKDGTVDGAKITTGTIHNLQIADVDGSKIAVASITGDKIVSVTESQVTGLNDALALKANLASPTFTGTIALNGTVTSTGPVTLPENTSIGSVTHTELGYVHGVTSAIQTQLNTGASNLTSHSSATTNVHGIADTSLLATKSYADSAVSTEATNRATAVTNAIATAEGYTDTAIATEVTNRNAAIATSLTTAEGYTDTAKASAISTSEGYTDAAIATEVTARNSAITTATANVVKTTDTGTVTSTMIADGTIVNADISATAAIANTKLANSSVVINGTTINLGDTKTITADASTLTNTTLNSTVVNSSLTSVGTLGSLAVTGNTTIGGNITISGNATIQGQVITTNSSVLNVTNPIIYLAEGNTNNSVDIGFVGHFNDGTYQHTGLARDHANGTWKLFTHETTEPTSVIDWPNATFAPLQVSTLTGNVVGNVTGNADTATKLATARNINGVAFDGSAAITVKASTTNALTIGTGLSGTSFDGSGAVTIAIDSTVATLTGTQTLTNKTLTSPTITLPSAGITFSDGTIQTVAGVPSLTTIATAQTTSASLNPATYRDQFVPVTGGNTFTIADAGCAVGTSVNFWQNAGTLAVIAVSGSGTAAGATIVGTPGLKLRATNSVATAMKVSATAWILYGDLSA